MPTEDKQKAERLKKLKKDIKTELEVLTAQRRSETRVNNVYVVVLWIVVVAGIVWIMKTVAEAVRYYRP